MLQTVFKGICHDYGKIRNIYEYKFCLLQDNTILKSTDGWYNGRHLYKCPTGKGLIVPATRCRPDSRFAVVDMAEEGKPIEEDTYLLDDCTRF